MEYYYAFLVLFYGFAVVFKVYEVYHLKRQEKTLEELLNKLDKRFKD